jgi:hypothetical protein
MSDGVNGPDAMDGAGGESSGDQASCGTRAGGEGLEAGRSALRMPPSPESDPDFLREMVGEGGPLPQLTACFRSALILASLEVLNSLSAKATGHRVPSSRLAASLKPSVAYRVLNF